MNVHPEEIVRLRPLDERELRRRRWRLVAGWIGAAIGLTAGFCLFISGLLGVPQSFVGQWWMHPPRPPHAAAYHYAEGEICQMESPGVYCYEWYYRTAESVEEVIAYYESVNWPFHSPIEFEWRRGRRFGLNWVAEDNIQVFSNICGYQIIVRPLPDGNTEIYILERGAMGDYRPSEK